MPPKELWEAYSNHTVRLSVRPSVPLRVRCISPIFFEIEIPNLVCAGFQAGPTFPIFPTFLISSYFSLLFLENALLFHSKMSFTRKNQEFFLDRFALSEI